MTTNETPGTNSSSTDSPSAESKDAAPYDPLAGEKPAQSASTSQPQSDPTTQSQQSKPRIGDSRPAPAEQPEASQSKNSDGTPDSGSAESGQAGSSSESQNNGQPRKRKRRRKSNTSESDDGTAGSEFDNNEADSVPVEGERSGRAQDADGPKQRDQASSSSRRGSGQKKSSGAKSENQRQGRHKQDSQKQGGARQEAQKPGGQKQGSQKQGGQKSGSQKQGSQRQRARKGQNNQPVEQVVADRPVDLNEKQLKRRRGRSRKGRPVGRYMMVVSKRQESTHIAVVEGRQLVEYVVSRPSDDVTQIHGNIYLGRVQNVLPGMEAAFVDIGTPKNAVLYRADIAVPGVKSKGRGNTGGPKIEELLKPRQMVVCQVTKNPIAHKGARLTMEVSLPGRFVVLVPNSETYGISKRLPDSERKRLRQLLDKIRPKGHGLIVRTAAENVTAEEIERDVRGLQQQWDEIEALSKRTQKAAVLYREPDMSTRVIREEFNKEYRAVIIDNQDLYDNVSEYVSIITPALAERVEFYDATEEPISAFERFHVHEQLHKALDRKVWLPSGGSLIIEATEALTVIDVNTGKNVGSSSLEETVFRNNLEAAEEVAHQLRLRDIGGIIVIDFVDMEDRKNREEVMKVFRQALARDKTRTQAFGISDLGLVEMTRKRIGEGLVESMSALCPDCGGRGLQIDEGMIDKLMH